MRKRERSSLFPLSLAIALMACVGCLPGYIKIRVNSEGSTNQGLPFYMVVRAVDPKAYLAEAYADVAPKVVSPDATVIKTQIIYPGTPVTVWAKVPDKLAVAAYFLLTAPTEPWRVLYEAPVPLTSELELQGNRLKPDAKNTAQPPPPPTAPDTSAAPTAPTLPGQ